MKTLIITPDITKLGGVANYYKAIEEYLVSEDIEYFTACRRDGESRFKGALRLLQDYRAWGTALGSKHFDLVHLNPSLGPKALIRDGQFLRIAKKKGKKVVVFFHGWDKHFEKQIRKRWLWLFKKIFFQADAFIVLADEFKTSLIEMGYKGPIHLETTLVRDSMFKYYHKKEKKAPETHKFNMLFLSRIEKAKGIYEAIDAYAILKERRRGLTFTVAGDGTELENVKKYVSRKRIQGVAFKGFVRGQEKKEVFRSADCYLLPSYSEGMPGSVLEAMAFGLPVITRYVGGLKDFFEEGKMGFVTDRLEPEIFADLIERIVVNPELSKQMSQYNHEYAKKRFMASIVAKRLTAIYTKVFE
jgi:glycosyltransferase involved in cell wall biosynthesis